MEGKRQEERKTQAEGKRQEEGKRQVEERDKWKERDKQKERDKRKERDKQKYCLNSEPSSTLPFSNRSFDKLPRYTLSISIGCVYLHVFIGTCVNGV